MITYYKSVNYSMKALELISNYSIICNSGYHFVKNGIMWSELKGKTIMNENLILKRYGDVNPFKIGPVFHCKKLFLEYCDKILLHIG